MKQALTTLLTLFITSVSLAQDFQSALQKFTGAFVPERLHIHFDKTSYSPGDTVWFKAYIVEGILPTQKSKTMYIDWTDQMGKIIARSESPIAAGATFGQIAIPADYNAEFLHVKAYTRWMLNFDSAFIYNNDLRIFIADNKPQQKENIRYTLNLFPESGNLVANLNNKVAFKATDQYGRPAEFTGNIMINGATGNKISPVHDGMGSFIIRPQAGKNYSVSWKDDSGASHTTPFPDVSPEGLILQVYERGKNKLFAVENTNPAITAVRLIGTMFHQPVFNITKNLTDGTVQGVIPVESLPSGILTITVLDQDYHPLAERITFVNNGDYRFETEMNVEHWGLNKRARNEIEISIPENMTANLSVSVTDNFIDFDTTQSIISDILLSSELKGKIYNPVFYFTGEPDSTRDLLDLVMMTNGWRKISWTDLAEGRLPEIKFPADTAYQTISGKIYGATQSQLTNAENLVLIVNQKGNNEFLATPINKDGTFNVEDYMLFDTASVYYQPPKSRLFQNISVQFMQNKLPPQSMTKAGIESYIPNPDTSGTARHSLLSQAMLDELNFYHGKVLETVTVTARTQRPEEKLDEKYTSGMFSGGDATSFSLLDDPSAAASMNIFQYLQGRIAGVNISMSQPPVITWRGGQPTLFLDEMPVDADMLSSIPVSDIAYVKAFRPPFMGAAGGGSNGAIAIYTRRGGDVQQESGKGLSKNKVTGYSVIRQFYSPDYERSTDEKKDLRTTLYWNPEVILNPQNRTALLKFFNNDVTEAFRVVIEGMSPDGKMTRLITVME